MSNEMDKIFSDNDGTWMYDSVTDKMTRVGDAPRPVSQKVEPITERYETNEEKRWENYKKLRAIAKKYFGTEEMPWPEEVRYALLDKNLDQRIRSALFHLANVKRGYRDIYKADYASYRIWELEQAEKVVEQEKQMAEEKEAYKMSLIDSFRKSYQSKNFLWRFFNKKMSPKNLNLDNMDIEQLESLTTQVKGK